MPASSSLRWRFWGSSEDEGLGQQTDEESESVAQGERYTGGNYQLSKVGGYLLPEPLYMAQPSVPSLTGVLGQMALSLG